MPQGHFGAGSARRRLRSAFAHVVSASNNDEDGMNCRFGRSLSRNGNSFLAELSWRWLRLPAEMAVLNNDNRDVAIGRPFPSAVRDTRAAWSRGCARWQHAHKLLVSALDVTLCYTGGGGRNIPQGGGFQVAPDPHQLVGAGFLAFAFAGVAGAAILAAGGAVAAPTAAGGPIEDAEAVEQPHKRRRSFGTDEQQRQAARRRQRRQGMEPDQRQQHLSAHAAAEAARVAAMTAEQRQQHLAAHAAAEAARVAAMITEQRQQHLAAHAAAEAARRAGMDEEQRQQHLAAHAAAEAARVAAMTAEQRQQHLAAHAAAEAARVAAMTAEQRQQHLAAHAAARRAGMDEEQRAAETGARQQRRARQRFTASTERGPAIRRKFEEVCNHVCECCRRCFYRAGVTVTEHELLVLPTGAQTGARGIAVTVRAETAQMVQQLPRNVDDAGIVIMRTGAALPNGRQPNVQETAQGGSGRPPNAPERRPPVTFRCRIAFVMAALRWLKLNNPLYAAVEDRLPGALLVLPTGAQTGARGIAVTVRAETAQMVQQLPRNVDDAGIVIMRTGAALPNGRQPNVQETAQGGSGRPPNAPERRPPVTFRCRIAFVMAALRWLKLNNPLYAAVEDRLPGAVGGGNDRGDGGGAYGAPDEVDLPMVDVEVPGVAAEAAGDPGLIAARSSGSRQPSSPPAAVQPCFGTPAQLWSPLPRWRRQLSPPCPVLRPPSPRRARLRAAVLRHPRPALASTAAVAPAGVTALPSAATSKSAPGPPARCSASAPPPSYGVHCRGGAGRCHRPAQCCDLQVRAGPACALQCFGTPAQLWSPLPRWRRQVSPPCPPTGFCAHVLQLQRPIGTAVRGGSWQFT
eukprot:XP_001700719.1 predicted protein [Chlamydomonas reinhardtii]